MTSYSACLLFDCLPMWFHLQADVQQQGWTLDPASRMLTVKKQPHVTEQKLDPSKMQCLTEYVFHLEHWFNLLNGQNCQFSCEINFWSWTEMLSKHLELGSFGRYWNSNCMILFFVESVFLFLTLLPLLWNLNFYSGNRNEIAPALVETLGCVASYVQSFSSLVILCYKLLYLPNLDHKCRHRVAESLL